jgi:hypothetical protein
LTRWPKPATELGARRYQELYWRVQLRRTIGETIMGQVLTAGGVGLERITQKLVFGAFQTLINAVCGSGLRRSCWPNLWPLAATTS